MSGKDSSAKHVCWGPAAAKRDPHQGYPTCIERFLKQKNWNQANEHDWPAALAGCGRAVARARLAAELLATVEWVEADLYAYTAVSACRSAIDSFSHWINRFLGVGASPGVGMDVSKKEFRNQLDSALVAQGYEGMRPRLDQLAQLAREIDKWRQVAQHREGLFVRSLVEAWQPGMENIPNPRQWRIARPGVRQVTEDDPVVYDLVLAWAAEIEAELCAILALKLRTPPIPGENTS